MRNLCLGCMNPAAGTQYCPYCGYAAGTPAKEPYHIAPGTMLRHYLIGRVLGYGGFGVTYLGFDTQFGIKVAIKEYLPGELATRMPGDLSVTVYSGEKTEMFAQGRDKFLDEARRLAKFASEPGIVTIRDEFDENGTSYIVMEYLEGETLKQRLEREKKIPADEAVGIMLPVLDALAAVHEKGIVHRDISPDNIFLTKDGRIKLLDFGAARYAGTGKSKSLSVILKPGYAPEEQYRTHGEQGPWSDVYACAATLYKMITSVTPTDAMERIVKDDVQPPSKKGAKIDKNTETAIMNALNIYKDNRTQSAKEFREQLAGAKTSRMRNTHKHVDNGSWKTWHKALLASVLGLLVLVIGVSLYGYLTAGNPVAVFKQVLGSDETKIPNVIGLTDTEAKEKVEAAKLIPLIVDGDYSDTIPAGMIVNQYQRAGRKVHIDTTVEMVMSRGKMQLELKNLQGRDAQTVIAELTEQGFEVETKEEYSNTPKGCIISQSVEPGIYDKGTVIVLTVSLGLENIDETVDVEVGNFVSKMLDQAQAELSSAGIYVQTEYRYSAEPEGTVLSQDIEPGTTVKQGATLTLTVSAGREVRYVPNCTGMTEAAAAQSLNNAGIRYNIAYAENDLYADGTVFRQSPEANTAYYADEGSAVTIYVAINKVVSKQSTAPTTTTTKTTASTTKTTTSTTGSTQSAASSSSTISTDRTTMHATTPTAPVVDDIVHGDMGSGFSWTLSNGTLTIYGDGEMPEYNPDSYPWYNSRNNIKKVVFSGKPTSIGYCAFIDCNSLTSVTIPNSVTSIGKCVFEGCENLTSITIPDSVTSIGSCAFRYCQSLTSITIPNGVTSIEYAVFESCESLTSVTIPESVTDIGWYAFKYCNSLTSITIPDSVTSIGWDAFYYCTGLTSIEIPNSVASIGNGVFEGCENLTFVTIPNSVTSIGDGAFEYCTSLKSIIIPNSVTSIGDYAFYDCSNLNDIQYNGTIAQWIAVKKGSNWLKYASTSTSTVHCTDGDISADAA
ncbi:MAG: leucine-rich repeat protein [Oscillospiraceae bacterium]|nr:leucine-rich repeat protein [Oscillospiraceae bacterium]